MAISSTTPPTDDGSAALNAALSATRAVLVGIGTLLAAHGLGSSGIYFWVELVAGSIMTIGPLIWGMYTAWAAVLQKRKDRKIAVNATLKLVADNKMIVDHVGAPLEATEESAAAIVKDYSAPPVVPVPPALKAVG